jgi:O-antigen/teichoic acid export membrane protein
LTERPPTPTDDGLAVIPASESVQATSEAPAFGDELVVSKALTGRAVSGVLWSATSRLGQQLIQFGTSVVLARLLVPEAFGLVAEVLVFTNFAWVLVDFGFSAALIQRENLEERHITSAFWLNLAVGLFLTVATIAISPAVAAFYHQPRLGNLTIAMSGAFVLGSLGIVQGTLLERDLNFHRLALITNSATLVAGAAGIAAAFSGLGVWSIVLEALVAAGLRSALLWATSTWRPSWSLDTKAVRELWAFSANLAGFNAVNFWARNADNLLIGRFVAPASLGIYSRAYSLMMVPLNQVTSTVSVAMYPALARLQTDRERLRSTYLGLVGIVAFVSFPLATGLFVAARPFVLTLYGERWDGVIRVLQILCIPLLLQSVGSTVGLIYQTCGRTDWLFRWGLAASGVVVVSFALGVHWGIEGVATSYAIASITLFYFNFTIPGRLIGLGFGELLRPMRAPLAVAGIMAVIVWLTGRATSALGNGATLGIEVTVGVGVYIGVSSLCSLRALTELSTHLRRVRGTSSEPGGTTEWDGLSS